MYATQCVLLVGCKITILTSVVYGPSVKYIFTSFKDKEEKICRIFVFEVASFVRTKNIEKVLEGQYFLNLNNAEDGLQPQYITIFRLGLERWASTSFSK